MASMNVFLTEGNVEIYLSRLCATKKKPRWAIAREHLENGERRVGEGRERIVKQRQIVDSVPLHGRAESAAVLLLETLEQTQALPETHLMRMQRRWESRRL